MKSDPKTEMPKIDSDSMVAFSFHYQTYSDEYDVELDRRGGWIRLNGSANYRSDDQMDCIFKLDSDTWGRFKSILDRNGILNWERHRYHDLLFDDGYIWSICAETEAFGSSWSGETQSPDGFDGFMEDLEKFYTEQYLKIAPDLSKMVQICADRSRGRNRGYFSLYEDRFYLSNKSSSSYFSLLPGDKETITAIVSGYPLTPGSLVSLEYPGRRYTTSIHLNILGMGGYYLTWYEDEPEWVHKLTGELLRWASEASSDPRRSRLKSFMDPPVRKPGAYVLSSDTLELFKEAISLSGGHFPLNSDLECTYTRNLIEKTLTDMRRADYVGTPVDKVAMKKLEDAVVELEEFFSHGFSNIDSLNLMLGAEMPLVFEDNLARFHLEYDSSFQHAEMDLDRNKNTVFIKYDRKPSELDFPEYEYTFEMDDAMWDEVSSAMAKNRVFWWEHRPSYNGVYKEIGVDWRIQTETDVLGTSWEGHDMASDGLDRFVDCLDPFFESQFWKIDAGMRTTSGIFMSD